MLKIFVMKKYKTIFALIILMSTGVIQSFSESPADQKKNSAQLEKDKLFLAGMHGPETPAYIIEQHLATGANINTIDVEWRNFTPLHHAVNHNRADLVKILLEAKANVHALDDRGYTPLDLVWNYHSFTPTSLESLPLLLQYGSDSMHVPVNQGEKGTMLLEAAARWHKRPEEGPLAKKCVISLFKYGAKPIETYQITQKWYDELKKQRAKRPTKRVKTYKKQLQKLLLPHIPVRALTPMATSYLYDNLSLEVELNQQEAAANAAKPARIPSLSLQKNRPNYLDYDPEKDPNNTKYNFELQQ